MVQEKGYTERLTCSKSTKEMIMEECVEELKRAKPEFEDLNITSNFILKRIANYYLGRRQ